MANSPSLKKAAIQQLNAAIGTLGLLRAALTDESADQAAIDAATTAMDGANNALGYLITPVDQQ